MLATNNCPCEDISFFYGLYSTTFLSEEQRIVLQNSYNKYEISDHDMITITGGLSMIS